MDTTSPSLLVRACQGQENAWTGLNELYRPLLHHWLSRAGMQGHDADDLIQDILAALVQLLPQFQHNGRPGAFRTWLRNLAINRARGFWRARQYQAVAAGGSEFLSLLEQLEDDDSELSRQWDQEHDQHVLHCLLQLLSQEFEPRTLTAFRRLAIDGAEGRVVAEELGLSVGAVYVARSRVLARLRQEAEGIID